MRNNNKTVNHNLVEVSRTIDDLLKSQNEEDLHRLIEMENWLKSQFEKIRLQREDKSQVEILKLDNQELRADAIFIFDSSLNIISYSGARNLLSALFPEEKGNLNILDIVELAEQQKLRAAIKKAIDENQKISIELNIKTNINLLSRCQFEIDISSGNPANNRYVAHLWLDELSSRIITEYQDIILDNLPETDIYIFDSNYRFIVTAGKEKERFNHTSLDFIGKSMFDVLSKKTIRNIYPFCEKALKGEKNEGEVRYKDYIYSVTAAPIKDFENNTVAGILILQNITTDKQLEEQLKEGKEKAQLADKYKSIFIANISHEIRTPLNAIVGFGEQIEKTDLTPEQYKYVSLIKKASDQLMHLVTEIVFLFKIGMGKVYIENINFSLNELLEDLKDVIERQTSEKNIDFEIEKDPLLPNVLIGDPFRLRQILMNLLVNAIKYTDHGKITLICKPQQDLDINIILIFEVKDTGRGIHKKDLPNIFNVFEQGNKNQISNKAGAGLGLGICKELVELLNGEIKVSSKLKVGTTFSISLPYQKSTLDEISYKSKHFEIDDKSLAGKKILLADDDEHSRLLFDIILNGWKTDYTLLENGLSALSKLKKTKYDLVLLDINMPKKNGVEVVKSIRSNDEGINYKTPFVFITANALMGDINKYLKAGFNNYLIKPFKEEELYNKLCNTLDLEPLKKNKKVTAIPETHNAITETFNTRELINTAKGDHAFFDKMITNFITNAETLKKEFKQGVSKKQWNVTGEKAHKAIPLFKYFSLNKIVCLLKKIEDFTLRDQDYLQAAKVIEEIMIEIDDAVKHAKSTTENMNE